MSSYYGIVFPEFWTGDTGREIQAMGGKDAQVFALYLMSCRHATMIGLYYLPIRDIRHETGLSQKGLARAAAVLHNAAFAEYDAATEHVWVREMAKFRLGLQKKSPLDPDDKRVRGVQNLYERIADNPFVEPFFDRYHRELRLKKKRSCGLPVTTLLDVAPSKGLARGFQGPCKPDNRSTEISRSVQQGSGNRENLPAHSRRAVQILSKIHEPEVTGATSAEHTLGMATALCDRRRADQGRPDNQRQRVEGEDQRPVGRIGFRSTASGSDRRGDVGGGAEPDKAGDPASTAPPTEPAAAVPVDASAPADEGGSLDSVGSGWAAVQAAMHRIAHEGRVVQSPRRRSRGDHTRVSSGGGQS